MRLAVIFQPALPPRLGTDRAHIEQAKTNQSGDAAIPEGIAYEFFFLELVDWESAASRTNAGKNNSNLEPSFHQRLLGLSADDYSYFRTVATEAVAVLEANDRKARQIIQAAKGSPVKARGGPRLGPLYKDNHAAISKALDRIRVRFGPQSFQRLDSAIRTHIGKNLRVRSIPLPASRDKQKGGN